MAHYLLSSKSKTLSLKHIFRLSEDEDFKLLKANRWGNPDKILQVTMSKLQDNPLKITTHKCLKYQQLNSLKNFS